MAEISNDTYSVQAMRFFRDAWPNGVVTLDGVIAYYRGQGVFFDRFGATVRTVPQDKVKAAMESLARKSGGNWPRIEDFFNALAAEVGSVSAGDVVKAGASGAVDAFKFVGETALDFGKSSLIVYVLVAAIGSFVLPKLLKSGALK